MINSVGVARGASAAWRDAATAIEGGAWRDAPVALDWLAPLEITLAARLRDSRLAGQSVEARRIRLEAADGRARLDVAAASDLGRMRGEIALDALSSGGSPRVSVEGRLEGVDMRCNRPRPAVARAAPPLVAPPELPEGTLDVHIDLATRGDTLGAMATALDGDESTAKSRRTQNRRDRVLYPDAGGLAVRARIMTEQDGPLIPSAGRTEFDTGGRRMRFVLGVARIFDCLHSAARADDIDMRAEADLGSGLMRAVWAGNGSRRRQRKAVPDRFDLPFGWGGTLAAPGRSAAGRCQRRATI